MVSAHKFLLTIEGLGDDTDKELNEKQADADYEDHCVHDHKDVVILDRLFIRSNSINRVKHDIDPALSSLNCDEGKQTIVGSVEVEVGLDPFTTIIVAVPHIFDVLNLLLHRHIKMTCLA